MNKHRIDYEKLMSSIAKEFTIVWMRWVVLILVAPLYVFVFNRPINLSLILAFAAAFSFNFLNHSTLSNKKYPVRWFEKNIYIDVFLVSWFIASDGGYQSLGYIAYYIFIIYEGVKRDIKHPIILSAAITALYTAIVFIASYDVMSIKQLLFRDMFFIVTGLFVSDMVGQYMKFNNLRKKEYNMAVKDKLTGLYNRNELEKELQQEIEYCMKENASLCVMMFDLDNFKSFNDTYGHLTGDDLLRYFSKIVQETVASPSKAFRYGGEEFLIVLKDTELKEAYKIAEIIRKKLSSSNIFIKNESGRFRVTTSCGIASCPEHSVGFYELLEFADRALYEAKSEGKNKVVIAEKEI